MAAQRSKADTGRQATELLRRLPSVDRLLREPSILTWADETGFGRTFVRGAANHFLDDLRAAVLAGEMSEADLDASLEDLAAGVRSAADRLLEFRLRPVINATGVVVHTNLGRSLWSGEAIDRVASLSQRYLNLEFDLGGGVRGHREAPVEHLFQQIVPGAAVAVVNNNAAAVLLVLNTLADGKEVVVSRGQLVEIGGSFRIPEVMVKSGSVLREVGTTNRTRLADYEAAVGPETGVLLAVHPSNYRVVGFTESVSLAKLVELGGAREIPVVEDMGSGNILEFTSSGISDEPTVQNRLATGVDLVTFSGDKLLGGPQAGFVVGKPEYVARVRANPLYRALRLDKAIMLALEATLAAYVSGRLEPLPTIAMLRAPLDELRRRAAALVERLAQATPAAHFEVVAVGSRVGGGAAPEQDLPSSGIAVDSSFPPDELADRLRRTDPPVIARIAHDRLVLDVRTILPDEEDELVASLTAALASD